MAGDENTSTQMIVVVVNAANRDLRITPPLCRTIHPRGRYGKALLVPWGLAASMVPCAGPEMVTLDSAHASRPYSNYPPGRHAPGVDRALGSGTIAGVVRRARARRARRSASADPRRLEVNAGARDRAARRGAASRAHRPAIRKHLEAIVGFSKADRARGEKAWGRITGFRAADETHSWVLQQFKAAGLRDAEMQTYAATQAIWHPEVVGGEAGRESTRLEPAPRCGARIGVSDERVAAAAGPITAPLVFVGATTDAALPDVDVKGKVAVQTCTRRAAPSPSARRTTERARELAKRGAVAVLNVIEQAGNMHVRDFSNCGVPCFNLGTDDGRFLDGGWSARRGGAADDLRVRDQPRHRDAQGLKGHNTIGIVPGRRDDEIVIVNAHADGWFDAAGDNGDGLAVLVALARHFAKPSINPSARCCSWRAAVITAAA